MEKEGQNFLFKTEQAGTYTLKFYKQDFIQDYLINDYVQVIVNPASPVARTNQTLRPIDQGRVIAGPRWPPLAGEAEANRDPADSAPQPPPEAIPLEAPQPPSPASSPPIDYVQQAREAYAAGQFPQALSFLDQFREQYPAGTDEAWWLYGQSLEALSPSRDIRSALDYYRRLIREYPQSLRGNEARRRIAYLERYYFTIQ
jgi:TolA-binding protein